MENNEVQEESGLSLVDIWNIIVKNVWIIVISTVVCLIGGGLYGYVIKTPTYKSNGSIMVQVESDSGNINETSTGVTTALRITTTVASLMKEELVTKKVAEQVYGDASYYKEVVSGLTVTASTTNLFVSVTYESTDKDNVKKIVDTVIDTTIEVANDTENYNFKVLEGMISKVGEASNAKYASPNKTLTVLVGAVAGLVIGLVIAFIKELTSDKIQSKKDIEDKFNLRIIGLIPDFDAQNKYSRYGRKTKGENK